MRRLRRVLSGALWKRPLRFGMYVGAFGTVASVYVTGNTVWFIIGSGFIIFMSLVAATFEVVGRLRNTGSLSTEMRSPDSPFISDSSSPSLSSRSSSVSSTRTISPGVPAVRDPKVTFSANLDPDLKEKLNKIAVIKTMKKRNRVRIIRV